ncbi:MAG: sulfotransferase family 2 domain-containing protein [Planctomycetes bacterium]|nr:sulfotransferase family 2 domain-containing protein [Planctomycetota bacterium]
MHTHHVALRDVPPGDLFMFFVRDPISRFASAFRSRQRQGRPRYHTPWSEEERCVFDRFHSPNELAHALASDDAARRAEAEAAMRAIRHVRTSYWDWFGSEAVFRARLSDLYFVGFQETLPEDFAALRAKLGLPDTVTLPEDDVAAHRTPLDVDVHLDEDAQAILRRWYEKDCAFVGLCREIADRPAAC